MTRKTFKQITFNARRYGKRKEARSIMKAALNKGETVYVWTSEGCFKVPKGCPLDEIGI